MDVSEDEVEDVEEEVEETRPVYLVTHSVFVIGLIQTVCIVVDGVHWEAPEQREFAAVFWPRDFFGRGV